MILPTLEAHEKEAFQLADHFRQLRANPAWKKIRDLIQQKTDDALNEMRMNDHPIHRANWRAAANLGEEIDTYIAQVEEARKSAMREVLKASGMPEVQVEEQL